MIRGNTSTLVCNTSPPYFPFGVTVKGLARVMFGGPSFEGSSVLQGPQASPLVGPSCHACPSATVSSVFSPQSLSRNRAQRRERHPCTVHLLVLCSCTLLLNKHVSPHLCSSRTFIYLSSPPCPGSVLSPFPLPVPVPPIPSDQSHYS